MQALILIHIPSGNPGNKTNPITNIRGTASQLVQALDQLTYIPPKGLNSGFPPKKYQRIRIVASGVPLPLDIDVQLLPVNDIPEVIGDRFYEVQEDRATSLSPAVQVKDDADDVDTSAVEIFLQVRNVYVFFLKSFFMSW